MTTGHFRVSHVTSQESERTNSRFDPVSPIRTIGRRRSPRVGYVSSVNTAQGPVTTTDIGVTLMHEHVFIMTTEIAMNYPEAWGDEDKRVADAIERLNELKSRGVDTIVDLTVIGLGRYIPRIARVAAATDLNIVVATGLYTYNDVPLYFHYRGSRRDCSAARRSWPTCSSATSSTGIADTGVKAANPQVRHRRTRRHAGCRAGAARGRPGAPADRGADLDAHPRRDPARSRAAEDLRRGGRRPEPGGHRALRRHHRHRLPRGAHRRRAPTWGWTGSASTSSCRSRTG